MVAEEKTEASAMPLEPPPETAGRRMVVLEDFKPVAFLDDDDRASAVRRYSTLFVVDGRTRKGGLGRVLYAENAWGDRLAVKVLTAEEGADLTEEEQQALASRREAAFRREYESSRLLTGIAGFPTLFGQGRIDGQPALIMEWVEGQTLEEARRRLSVDDDGRLSPLVAAAIGRDLFDLLSRMELVDGGLVHRDISPSNVMIRTQRTSVEEQAAQGKFDLVLVDFGSTVLPARASSLTVRYGAPQGATPDYAAPEMLTADVARVADMRKSPAVDVYAAASVVYLLLCGRPPFQLGGSSAGGEGAEVASDYLRKTTELPLPVRAAHGESADVTVALDREGEAVAAVRKALADERLSPSNQELKEALVCVDKRVGEVVLAALEPDQRHRPSAAEMREGLAGFVEAYPANVVAALQGEPLFQDWSFDERRKAGGLEARRRAGARLARWAAVVVALGLGCAAAALCSGVRVTAVGSLPCSLEWGFPLVAALALAPAAAGYLVRWRGGRKRSGLVRGSVALAVVALTLLVAAGCSADATQAASYTIDYIRSLHGAEVVTPSAPTGSAGQGMAEAAERLADVATMGLLRIVDGYVVGAPFWLAAEPGAETVVGALAEQEGSLRDVGVDVSGRHARIWRGDDGVWYVEGLESRNGTVLVDGATRERMVVEPPADEREGWQSAPVPFRPGDELVFAADTRFVAVAGVAK